MSLAKQLDQAAERFEVASSRIAEVRSKPPTQENVLEWLATLTELALASADIQRFANESIHEKLHALAGRLKVEDVL
jgi:hypothetical protein